MKSTVVVQKGLMMSLVIILALISSSLNAAAFPSVELDAKAWRPVDPAKCKLDCDKQPSENAKNLCLSTCPK